VVAWDANAIETEGKVARLDGSIQQGAVQPQMWPITSILLHYADRVLATAEKTAVLCIPGGVLMRSVGRAGRAVLSDCDLDNAVLVGDCKLPDQKSYLCWKIGKWIKTGTAIGEAVAV